MADSSTAGSLETGTCVPWQQGQQRFGSGTDLGSVLLWGDSHETAPTLRSSIHGDTMGEGVMSLCVTHADNEAQGGGTCLCLEGFLEEVLLNCSQGMGRQSGGDGAAPTERVGKPRAVLEDRIWGHKDGLGVGQEGPGGPAGCPRLGTVSGKGVRATSASAQLAGGYPSPRGRGQGMTGSRWSFRFSSLGGREPWKDLSRGGPCGVGSA